MSGLNKNDQAIVKWLAVCLLLIFAMIMLGGVTRLTGSGLSMVNWHPIHGAIPPLTSEAWQEEFSHYQQSPEFKTINQNMDVSAFKSIFWFEYSHRSLGRLIGLVFLIPFLYFFWRGKIRQGLTPKLMMMFCLGGLQGLLGWYMVKSGLVSNPQVSQYRLTAHLLAAILIYGFMLWTILDLIHPQTTTTQASSLIRHWKNIAIGLICLLLVTIVSGGFVAGLKAGLIYNTFPLMNGELIPEGIGALTPWYKNLFENRVTAQFNHRVLAFITSILLIVWYLKGRAKFESAIITRSFKLVGMAVIIQLGLGISTVLLQVPITLAVMHQAGALLLFSAMLMNAHALRNQI